MGHWHNPLCGCGTTTSLDYAMCETFTTVYDTVGGIGSSAMTALFLRSIYAYGESSLHQYHTVILDAANSLEAHAE